MAGNGAMRTKAQRRVAERVAQVRAVLPDIDEGFLRRRLSSASQDGIFHLDDFVEDLSDSYPKKNSEYAAQVLAVLPDVQTRFLKRRLASVAKGDSFDLNEFVLELSQIAYPRKKVVQSRVSALERAQHVQWQEALEDLWAEQLRVRGDDIVTAKRLLPSKTLKIAPEAYSQHALQALLERFPKVRAEAVRHALSRRATFAGAAAELRRNRQSVETMRIQRKVAPVPSTEVPIDLVYEIALGPHLKSIAAELRRRRLDRKARTEEARSLGRLWTCGCCYEEVLEEDSEVCSEGIHSFCLPCVRESATSFFGSNLFTLNFQDLPSGTSSSSSADFTEQTRRIPLHFTRVACPAISGCSGCFVDSSLRRSLATKDYQRYTRRAAGLHAIAAGVQDLVPCPACDFMVEMSSQSDVVVRCLSPDCLRVSCRRCGEPDHRPLRCDEVERDDELRLRKFVEEKMNELCRRCPQCHKPYEKMDGCNKMTCLACKTIFCYLCGEKIDKHRPYDHFKDGITAGGKNNRESRCVVVGTPAWAKKQGRDSRGPTVLR